jgi:hypothetical protein
MSVGLEFRGGGAEEMNRQSHLNKRRNSMRIERQESMKSLDRLAQNDLSQQMDNNPSNRAQNEPSSQVRRNKGHAMLKKSKFEYKDVQSDASDFSEGDLTLKETDEGCCSKTLTKSYILTPFLESFDKRVHIKNL